MEKHRVQSLGFQYGLEKFRQEVTSHVVVNIVNKLYENSSSSGSEFFISLISPTYTFADRDYVPKAVEFAYGKELKHLITEEIAVFEKVMSEVVNRLAPIYFKMMANRFEEDLKKSQEKLNNSNLSGTTVKRSSTKKKKNPEETASKENANK